MEKLYTQEHYNLKASRFISVEAPSPTSADLNRIARDQQGREISYLYHLTAEKLTKSKCKLISRKIVGWFLTIFSFGYLKNNLTVSAWRKGRRIDRIYLSPSVHDQPTNSHETTKPDDKDITPKNLTTNIVNSKTKDNKEVPPPAFDNKEIPPPALSINEDFFKQIKKIKLNKTYTDKKFLDELKIGEWEVLRLLRFADFNQDITSILRKYAEDKRILKTNKTVDDHKCLDKIFIKAGLEIVEQSLGIKLDEKANSKEKIVTEFAKRFICRFYHGTKTYAAKNIILRGVSFNAAGKGYEYEEFESLIKDCKLDITHWPFALSKTKNDKNKFYVSSDISNYAQNNAPEWFLRFREWGADENEDLNIELLRERVQKHNPDVINIERVLAFVQKHWKYCASKKKHAATLIVERNEKDKDLLHNREFNGSFHHAALRWDPNRELTIKNISIFQIFTIDTIIEKLVTLKIIVENSSDNLALNHQNCESPPKVVQAVKIPIWKKMKKN